AVGRGAWGVGRRAKSVSVFGRSLRRPTAHGPRPTAHAPQGWGMGRRWWHAIAGLGLAGLMACGQGPATVAVRSLDEPTATAAATGRGAATPGTGAAPAASAPPTATRPPGSAPPAPTRAPASPTAGGGAPAVPQPNGTIPAGWQVYRGPAALPVVGAYPPDW